jgi:tRNA pseudouridine55 synthase
MRATPTDTGGVLLVDKPAGITSHDVVSAVRRATKVRRVGHAGTLDPFATGLLVVLVGRGTRLIPFIDGEPKVYEAAIRFGVETDTDDLTGSVLRSTAIPDEHFVMSVLPALTGEIAQVPPAYSAKQIDGTRAYAAARVGTPIALEAVSVRVDAWEVLGWRDADLRVRITCGGGTYIRALARDLGRLTESAAHLAQLRRVAAGPFSVEHATTVDDLRAGEFSLRPLQDAIPSLPQLRLDATERARVVHGNPITNRASASRVALLDVDEELIAVADDEAGLLQPRLVLRDA